MVLVEKPILSSRQVIGPDSELDEHRALALFYTLLENTLIKILPPGNLEIAYDTGIIKVLIHKNDEGEVVLEVY